jgi:hypothetical protein
MQRVQHSTASATPPIYTFSGTTGYYSNGNSAIGIAATWVTAENMNLLQETILDPILTVGLAQSNTDYTQLTQSINYLATHPTTIVYAASGIVANGAISCNSSITSNTLTTTAGISTTGNAGIISYNGGIGYGTGVGVGGTVTQVTSKLTGVTLNKLCGQITTTADALAAGGTATFVFTNSTYTSNDLIFFVWSGGTVGAYTVQQRSFAAGAPVISITNNTTGSLSESLILRYIIVKSSTN